MEIYIAITVLTIFIVLGCVPLVVSMLSGIDSYFKCLLFGCLSMLCVAGIIACILVVLWSGMYVLTYYQGV